MNLFPAFLNLHGKRCLVAGGGAVGLEKAESLLHCGAIVRLVSPDVLPEFERLHNSGKIEWVSRRFLPQDLEQIRLVVAATNCHDTNREIFAEASRRGVLCNTVDDPPLCDFYYASVVERGDLQIAISTAGKSPAFAQRLRKEIDAQLPATTGAWLDELGQVRREVLTAMPAGEERKQLLHHLASLELCHEPQCPARQQVRAAVENCKDTGTLRGNLDSAAGKPEEGLARQ